MHHKIKITLITLSVLIVGIASFYIVWHLSTPIKYQFDVSNESDLALNKVSVFGTGVYKTLYLIDLMPGDVASLRVDLRPEGDLRFSVEQGANKIDHIISRDVTQIKYFKQWLTVYNNNRFIVSNPE